MIRFLLTLFAALSLGSAAQAQNFPKLTGRVVDAANLLSPEQEAQLTAMSDATEKATGRQLVVATVPDLQGYEIDEYGYKLGRAWQIGQKEADNGVILIVAPKERRVRIEVGYGLEPIVTDGLSGIIIRNTITPAFKRGDMGGGIVAGASAINEQLKLPLEAAEARAKKLIDEAPKQRRGGGAGPGIFTIIFWLAVLMFVILPIIFGSAKGKRYRRGGAPVVIWGPGWGGGSSGGGWGGGGFGGGGGGFGGGGFGGGGGSFGGGGASGGW